MPPASAPPPTSDHHAPIRAGAPAAARIEPLRHAAELRAPRDELLEALLGFLGDADPLAAGLLAEASNAAGGRALLLLRRGAYIELRQRPEHHDLVILDRDLHSLEPAVWEPSGKPTFDRSELFLIHNYIITLQNRVCQVLSRKLPLKW